MQLDVFDFSSNSYLTKYYQSYTYDEMGRLSAVSQKDSATSAVNFTATYGYDAAGNVISQQVVTPNLTTNKSFTYNKLGLMSGYEQTSTDGSINLSETYQYKLDGNLYEKISGEKKTTYSYDNLGRLTQEQVYHNDALASEISYTFDDFSNLSSKVETDYSSSSEGVAITDTFSYNLNCQLVSRTVVSDAISDTYTYSYDNRGNRSSLTKTGTSGNEWEFYQYNAFNCLVGAKDSEGRFGLSLYQYGYDPLDRRSIKVLYTDGIPEGSIYHYWDGSSIVGDYNAIDSEFSSYVFGLDMLGLKTGEEIYSYQTNARGDIDAILGTEDAAYTYDAYGNIKNDLSEIAYDNPYRYSGYYTDDDSGFYYLNARYYDPEIGSFTQRDSYTGDITQPDTLNLYAYCGGNPVLYSDPSGHLWETLFDIGSLAWSTWDLITNPSWENAGWFTLDLIGLAIPFIPSPGALKAVKWLNRGENLVDGLRTTKTVTRAANWAGDAARTTKTTLKSGLKTGADVIRSSKAGSNVLSSVDSIMASINDSLAAMKRASEALTQKNKKALVQRITSTPPNINASDVSSLAENITSSSKPVQIHHFATDKNSKYTPAFEEIASQYGLKLNQDWNKAPLSHQGRHPNAYHEYILKNMRKFDKVAQGNQALFLQMYEGVKNEILQNPDMLYKKYWTDK